MRYQIRHLAFSIFSVGVFLAITVPLIRWVNAPSIDDHNFGIGKTYRFVSFKMHNGDSDFQFNQDELDSLTKEWKFAKFGDETRIANHLLSTGTAIAYDAKLNDGFKMDCDIHAGIVDGIFYLNILLIGGSVSYPDAYSILLRADDFLEQARYNEFHYWLKLDDPPKNAG